MEYFDEITKTVNQIMDKPIPTGLQAAMISTAANKLAKKLRLPYTHTIEYNDTEILMEIANVRLGTKNWYQWEKQFHNQD